MNDDYIITQTWQKIIQNDFELFNTNGLEKVADIVVENTTDKIVIENLDGDNTSFYLLMLYFNNSYHEDVCADFGFNWDNNLNYKGYNVVSYNGQNINVTTIGRPYIGFCGAEAKGVGYGIAYIYPQSGNIRTVNMQVYQPNHSIWFKGWQWENTEDNIHTITVFTEEYNRYIDAIGPGTHLLLYRG